MRIAIVTDYLSPSRGGSECYLFSLVKRLVAQGHDLHVFYSRPGEQIHGVNYHLIQVPAYPRFFREWSFCRQVNQKAAELSPDATFSLRAIASATHYRLSNGVYLRCLEAEREALDGALWRFLYRSTSRLNPKRQLLIRGQTAVLCRENPPCLMTNSQLIRQHLQQEFAIRPERVTVLYSGVDLELFHPRADVSPAVGRLLFVGHHFRLKGLHSVMAAMSRPECAGLDLTLRVAGNGNVRQFKRLAARLGILSRVEFLGAVTRSKMPDLYHANTVLVLPTFYDPCSLATLEAMACGCPVITTRRNGAAELIESGRNGLVVDHPCDVEALSRAIQVALRCDVSQEMGREAAATARTRLDLDEHVKAVTRWLGG